MFVFTWWGYKTKNMFLSSPALLDTGDVTSAQSTELSCTYLSEEHVIGGWSGYIVQKSWRRTLVGAVFGACHITCRLFNLKTLFFDSIKRSHILAATKGLFISSLKTPFVLQLQSTVISTVAPFLSHFSIFLILFSLFSSWIFMNYLSLYVKQAINLVDPFGFYFIFVLFAGGFRYDRDTFSGGICWLVVLGQGGWDIINWK